MMYNYSSILFIATEKTGGLFDFDGTLPVIALQFLLLMFGLNFILYTPLLETIDKRNIYIKKSLDNASNILEEADQLTIKYEEKAAKARKAAKNDLTTYQKLYKDILDNEMKSSQVFIDEFITETTKNFDDYRDNLLGTLDDDIDSLSDQIISKILA